MGKRSSFQCCIAPSKSRNECIPNEVMEGKGVKSGVSSSKPPSPTSPGGVA